MLVKQERDDARLADEFLRKQAVQPDPKWYADLLDKHKTEIAAVMVLWFSEVEDALSSAHWSDWGDTLLWFALEERLAALLAPVLREAARSSARRQAIEADEPIPLRQADLEIALWAGEEAARQASLIVAETRAALIEASDLIEDAGAANPTTFGALLGAGIHGLNRRFAGSAVSPILTSGSAGLQEAVERTRRLFEVRSRMIEETNSVSSVLQGILVVALFWERAGEMVTKTWHTQRDERVCPVCLALDLQEVPLRRPFVSPRGTLDRPPAHPLCRCFLQVSVRPTDMSGLFL